jgi:hypothetical protein
MTKEKLLELAWFNEEDETHTMQSKDLEEFFNSNVITPMSKNRHQDADVLHQWVEGVKVEQKTFSRDSLGYEWYDFTPISHLNEYRIKSSEPTFEYKVKMMYSDGSYEYTERYFTEEEYEEFGFTKTCLLEDDTKRIRE